MSSIVVKDSEKHKKDVDKIIRMRMLYAAGFGLIPFPVIDAAGILGIQVLMVKDIATEYGIPFVPHIAKTLIGSLVGGLGTLGAVKLIPGLGTVLGGVTISAGAAATTYAIGKVFATHFDQGGTLLNFDTVSTRKYFEELFQEGQLKTEEIQKNKRNTAEKIVHFISPSKTNKTGKYSAKEEEQDLLLKANLKRREQVLEKRREMIRKNKRKTFFKKSRRYLVSIFTISLIVSMFYLWYVYTKEPYAGNPNTELDLYMEETMAKKVELQPTVEPDSLINNTIAGFAPNSTESVIAEYIQNPESTYPKRYALSAVRFINNSASLSSGGEEQLINIASLMKKYPDLTINLYGHSSSVGPKFSRQKIGRKRARLLKSIFINEGIPGFRLTGNYIEKENAVHNEYWGAEIVIDVSTEESAVVVEPPDLLKPMGKIQDAFSWVKSKLSDEPEVKTVPEPPVKTAAKSVPNKKIVRTADAPKVYNILTTNFEAEPISENTDSNNTEYLTEETIPESDSSANETDREPEIDSQDISEEEKENEEEKVKEEKEKEENKPAQKKIFPKGTTEAVMLDYMELPNASFPKAFALSHIRFRGTSRDLDARGEEQLKNLGTLMNLYPNMKISVYALIPGKGTEETTEEDILEWNATGKRRGQKIKSALKKMGISSRRIKTKIRRVARSPDDATSWGMEIGIENK